MRLVMKNFFGKKQVMLATLAVALGLAVYLNYYFSSKQPPVTSTGGTTTSTTPTHGNLGDSQFVNASTDPSGTGTTTTAAVGSAYFAQARANRESAREEALDILKELLSDVKSTDAMKQEATNKAAAIAKAVEQESKIEDLVRAKGFADCVVYIEDKNCNVVVQADGLKPQETLQITEIVSAQSNIAMENIKIVTVNS